MCFQLLTAEVADLPKDAAGELTKKSRRAPAMLPLRAQRTPKSQRGSSFLIVGITPGQGCSCGILHNVERGDYQVVEDMVEPLQHTIEFLAREAGPSGFAFSVLELSESGPALPPKFIQHTTPQKLLSTIAAGRLPRSTTFRVKAVA